MRIPIRLRTKPERRVEILNRSIKKVFVYASHRLKKRERKFAKLYEVMYFFQTKKLVPAYTLYCSLVQFIDRAPCTMLTPRELWLSQDTEWLWVILQQVSVQHGIPILPNEIVETIIALTVVTDFNHGYTQLLKACAYLPRFYNLKAVGRDGFRGVETSRGLLTTILWGPDLLSFLKQ